MRKSNKITLAEMRKFLVVGWGEIGGRTADAWELFNDEYFGGELDPLPIFFTNTTPFGKRYAHCCGNEGCRHIALNMPSTTGHGPNYQLIANRSVLLHEMIHQYLNETGENPKHAGEPWRNEIRRLHLQITGKPLAVSGQKIIKVRDEDTGKRKSVRVLEDPQSISQEQISRWPYSVGIDLGRL